MDNFNIVLLGENFPITSIDLADFEFLGRPARERVRMPVVLEAKAGEFFLSVLPERFQVGAAGTDPTADKVGAVMQSAHTFLEYSGRRTIRAVGHNFAMVVASDVGSKALGQLVGYAALADLFGGPTPEVDLDVPFEGGGASAARVKILTRGQGGSVALDFNFDFQIDKAGPHPNAESAIERFNESLESARSLADRFPSAIAAGMNA